jgi:hypothetical protein
MSLIGAIGEVTTGSGARIADTRAAYDALTDVQKSLIASSFLEKLLAAEARYSELTKVGEDGEQEFPSQQDSPQDPPQVPQQDPAPLPPEIASNAPQRTNLQAADVTAADMVWTGRRISSGLKVKAVFREGDGYVTKALRPETDYVLSEAGPNRSIGKATVVVTGKGAYEGVKTLTFHIVPKAPTNVGLAVAKKSLKVKWTKPAKAKEQKLTGYQVRYRASGAKKWTVRTYELRYNAGERTVSRTIGKLKSRKTYEAQVRAYRKITSGASGGVYYSAWITARRGS